MAFPTLHGSAKQVAWAEKIRAGYLAAMAAHEAKIHEALLHSRTMRRQVRDELRKEGHIFEWIKARTDGKWWIDHRGLTVHGLAMEAERQMRRVRVGHGAVEDRGNHAAIARIADGKGGSFRVR